MKTISFFEAASLIACLALANFVYQALFADQPNWATATERSVFQTNALLIAWWMWK